MEVTQTARPDGKFTYVAEGREVKASKVNYSHFSVYRSPFHPRPIVDFHKSEAAAQRNPQRTPNGSEKVEWGEIQ